MSARHEDMTLAKVRNVALDVLGTYHIMEAYRTTNEWTCKCSACQYVRAEPRLVASIYKALAKDSK